MHDAYAPPPEEPISSRKQAPTAYGDNNEAERRALALELHDTVLQPLTSLVVSLARLEHQQSYASHLADQLELWRGLAREALDSLRSSLAGLPARPQTSYGTSLVDALCNATIPVLASQGIRLTVHVDNWPTDLPPSWTTHLFLAIREALTNAGRHGSASRVSVELTGGIDDLTISVVDNGIGCYPEAVYSSHVSMPGHGLGIRSIHHRIQSLGGEVHIHTAPGCGMRIEMRVPRSGAAVIDQLTDPVASPVTRHAQTEHMH